MTLLNNSLKCLATIMIFMLVMSPAAQAQQMPSKEEVGFDQNLGETVPLDVTLFAHTGEEVTLQKYFGNKPVIIMPVYYKCPMLCGLELNAMVRCLRALSLEPGKDFELVTFSFDPREKPSLAKQKRKQFLSQYGNDDPGVDWHFLTAEQDSIDRLCKAIGFRAKYNKVTGEYAHAAGVVVCTPEGTISRYLFGVEFAPRDMRLAVVESAKGTIGSLADHVLLFCYMYDPTRGKYGLAIMNVLRAGGVLTVLVLGSSVGMMLRRERSAQHRSAEGGSDV